MNKVRIGLLHYSAPPVIGGVEAVIGAHARLLYDHGYPVTVIAGRGDPAAFPDGVNFVHIPELDTQFPTIIEASALLEKGVIPENFNHLAEIIHDQLQPFTELLDTLIVHNVFTKHFNLPLTAALCRLMDEGANFDTIAWCHDFTWTSPNSRHKVHDGYPWDLLRTYRKDMTYVVVSKTRQRTLAKLLNCNFEEIQVVYNGVDPGEVLGFSAEGRSLIERLGLFESSPILLMPVRITEAKNIEYGMHVTAELKKLNQQPKLVISGPPDPHDSQNMAYFNALQKLRHDLGLEEEAIFIYQSGLDPDKPYLIDMTIVAELLRAADIVFMPSHREGFGMPVVEAGLAGIPVISTEIPAAQEIGQDDVTIFNLDAPANETAKQILEVLTHNPVSKMRQKMRLGYTWEAIFRNDIQPLIEKEPGT
jgi:glycosyltransferase involved in cell wall biosynthesis